MPSILERFRVDGQVAIVTGSGRGIGRATALALADAGADIVVTARTLEQIEDTAAAVRERGRRALVVTCDVMDEAQREALVAKTMAEFGRLDILVNNAGGTPPRPALQTTDEQFNQSIHFNATTAFSMSRLCAPHMAASAGRGRELFLSDFDIFVLISLSLHYYFLVCM